MLTHKITENQEHIKTSEKAAKTLDIVTLRRRPNQQRAFIPEIMDSNNKWGKTSPLSQ